ncbi:MAG: ABC transporter substrate-binding protein [Acidobacteriota bacterium]|nr:ABC transporter substrate-binding protein [Acidobacteriota bacterium]
MRRRLRILSVISIIFFTFALALAQNEQPRRGGTIVVAISGDPAGLNPGITTQGSVHQITASIFSGLVAHDFNLNPVPDLATSWEVAPDGLRYTFHLAPNATFHDGVPLTSEDVKFTFEELLLKFHSRTRTSIGDKLKTILTPDPHTVVFEFNQPYAAFLQLLDVTNAPVMPKHIYANTDPLTNPYNVKPVGSGAFMFDEWMKGDSVRLKRNPNYFKESKPFLDRVVFKVTPSTASAAIAFENGEVDYLINAAPLDLRRWQNRAEFVITDKGREGYATVETLVPNLTNPALANLRVRQAIAHTIDRDFIVERVLFGEGVPAFSPVSRKLEWAYNPDATKYARDLQLAERLLDEAGYKHTADGTRFHLRLVVAAASAKVAEVLREQLGEIGITLDLQMLEFSAMVEAVYIRKDFDLAFSSFENGADPDIGVKRTLVSSNIGAIPFSNGALYRNPQVDELFARASSTLDKAERAKLYYEIQDIVTKELPYFWLYETRGNAAYKAGLRGMYGWSAKSNIYFAQDAWWAEGDRNTQNSANGRRRVLWIALGVVLLCVVALWWRKTNRRKA